MKQASIKDIHMVAPHLSTGKIGEKAVLNHLKRKGFKPIEINYLTKMGEIDLILERGSIVHFVEVKTVSCGTYRNNVSRETDSLGVSHGTDLKSNRNISRRTYRPEENVHRDKLRKILNTVQVWLARNKYTGEWQVDVAAVYLDRDSKRGRVRFIENVVVE